MCLRFARVLLALLVWSIAVSAWASPPAPPVSRLNPYLRRAAALAVMLQTPSARTAALVHLRSLDRTVALEPDAQPPSAVVRVAGHPSESQLSTVGAHLVSQGIASRLVRVPLVALPRLAALPGVVFVESLGRMRPRLDVSLPLTGADLVHTGEPGLTGTGVVYGSIDSGIDIRHPTFRNPDGTTRVEAFWDTCDTSGDPPAGFEDFGGTLYTREDIDAELDGDDRFPHVDANGHGTLTAGIGAGSGSEGDFVGMAPDATIVVVAIFGDEEGRCDNPNVANAFGGASSVVTEAARFIEATAASRPFVINMSIGDHVGPHDGASLLDRDLEALATAAPGRALVAAAGNEAAGGIHGGVLLPSDGTIKGIDAFGQFGYDGAIEIWYPADAEVELRVRQRAVCGETVETGDDALTDGYFVDNGRDGIDARNGDRVALVEVYGDLAPAGDPDACTSACDHFTQGCGQDPFGAAGACFDRCINAWSATRVDCVATYESQWGANFNCNGTFFGCLPVEFTVEMSAKGGDATRVDVYGAGFATAIDAPGPDMTLGEPASSHGVIAAAAFVHRAQVRGLEAQGALGALASYSSRGPTRDGRLKPEIAAPAELITSAHARGSDDGGALISRDGLWISTSGGTSSASPHVAGAIALLLQQYPLLELEGIHEALARGAGVDVDTGTPPDDAWGWGKLRVDQALMALDTPVTDADGDGFGAAAEGGLDCNDADPGTSPRAAETIGNGVDDDCDGDVDEPLPEGGFFRRADPLCADEIDADAGPDGGAADGGPVQQQDGGAGDEDGGSSTGPDDDDGDTCGCEVGAGAPRTGGAAAALAMLFALGLALRDRDGRRERGLTTPRIGSRKRRKS